MSATLMLGLITLTERCEDFLNGHQVGLMRYQLYDAKRALTDRDVYEMLARILFDTHNTDCYRAGVIAGWFAGLYAHCLQLGWTLPTLAGVSAAPVRALVPLGQDTCPQMQESR